jgi:hypothetical protein
MVISRQPRFRNAAALGQDLDIETQPVADVRPSRQKTEHPESQQFHRAGQHVTALAGRRIARSGMHVEADGVRPKSLMTARQLTDRMACDNNWPSRTHN